MSEMKFVVESDVMRAHFEERAAHYAEREAKLGAADALIVRPNQEFNRKRVKAAAEPDLHGTKFLWRSHFPLLHSPTLKTGN